MTGAIVDPTARRVSVTYLVVACRPAVVAGALRGVVHRHACASVRAAATAARVYRGWGWAVTVLPEATA